MVLTQSGSRLSETLYHCDYIITGIVFVEIVCYVNGSSSNKDF